MDEDIPVGTRMVTLNLSVSTKATQTVAAASGTPEDLHIWVYNDDSNVPLADISYNNLTWREGSNQIDFETTLEPVRIEVPETCLELKVYAVANTGKATWDVSDFSAISQTALKAKTFSAIAADATDSTVPMYVDAAVALVDGTDSYSTDMSLERCVGKLELYFTKNTEKTKLSILDVRLSGVPEYGYLAPSAESRPMSYKSAPAILYSGAGTPISGVLGTSVPVGDFSDHEAKFDNFSITEPYLFERAGLAWTTAAEKDDVYPFPDGTDGTDAYLLTLSYVLDGETINKSLYLSRIERNTRYRIFIRVCGNQDLEVNTSTIPWNEGKGDYTIDITPGLPVVGQ